MTQSTFSGTAVQRSTSAGTYTVGQDCSLNLKFSSAAGANSSNFTAPMSFRVLMTDSTTGEVSVQTDSTNTLTGMIRAQ